MLTRREFCQSVALAVAGGAWIASGFQVTAADIRNGRRGDIAESPVALALARFTDGGVAVFYFHRLRCWVYQPCRWHGSGRTNLGPITPLSDRVGRWISRHEAGWPVRPFAEGA